MRLPTTLFTAGAVLLSLALASRADEERSTDLDVALRRRADATLEMRLENRGRSSYLFNPFFDRAWPSAVRMRAIESEGRRAPLPDARGGEFSSSSPAAPEHGAWVYLPSQAFLGRRIDGDELIRDKTRPLYRLQATIDERLLAPPEIAENGALLRRLSDPAPWKPLLVSNALLLDGALRPDVEEAETTGAAPPRRRKAEIRVQLALAAAEIGPGEPLQATFCIDNLGGRRPFYNPFFRRDQRSPGEFRIHDAAGGALLVSVAWPSAADGPLTWKESVLVPPNGFVGATLELANFQMPNGLAPGNYRLCLVLFDRLIAGPANEEQTPRWSSNDVPFRVAATPGGAR
jgi:hypothetical protein